MRNKSTQRDKEYIDAYLKTGSTTKACILCGVSRETVARACRRNGLKLTGRKLNGDIASLHIDEKITNEQLIAEYENGLTATEIAKKYGMSQSQVYRRGKKLGITISDNYCGGHWYTRAKRYGARFDQSISLKELLKKYNGICQICGKPVDVESKNEKGHVLGDYPSLDHIIPLSKGGDHVWSNVQLAHVRCNAKKHDHIQKGAWYGTN